MELKLRSRLSRLVSKKSFNRTFMELKRKIIIYHIQKKVSFNRTFMELKHFQHLGKSR